MPEELTAAVQDSNIIALLDLVRYVKIDGDDLTPYQLEVKKMAQKYGVPSPQATLGGS